LYQVEDVFVRDRKLTTGGGNELSPRQEFKASLEKAEAKPPSDRLLRRGR
jgi:hypothetical protein